MFNKKLKTENYSLMVENLSLASENEELKNLVERRTSDCMTLEKTVDEQKDYINEISVENINLKNELDELKKSYASLYDALKKKAIVNKEEKRLEKENIPDKYKKEMLREFCGDAVDIVNALDLFFGLY